MAATDHGAATDGSREDGPRVLLCVTGGIAAYKAALLARLLVQRHADVTVLMTESATRFVGPDTFAALTRNPVHHGVFERPETVLHVRLAHAADVAVVAPATANVMAKLALGLADDLVTATLLEANCPLVLAPAMHSGMWNHSATRENVATLVERGAIVVGPETGPLAAGDEGIGRMAAPEEIEAAVLHVLSDIGVAGAHRDLAGARILVSAGPTHEPIDAVRFIGNRSSGTMGFEVAREAARRGASVTLVAGPVSLPDPPGVHVVRVETAAEMLDALQGRFAAADALVMAAAVADFRPEDATAGKIKKDDGVPDLRLERTADILATLAKERSRQVLVGFAAETADVAGGLEAEGRRKLRSKGADLLVVNEVGRPGTGFGSDTDRAAILDTDGEDTPLEEWTKADLARAICDQLAARLANP
jgi:phosphopantothenoylcysteine decarboxylase / phosphopantothenate---cysteine ligase